MPCWNGVLPLFIAFGFLPLGFFGFGTFLGGLLGGFIGGLSLGVRGGLDMLGTLAEPEPPPENPGGEKDLKGEVIRGDPTPALCLPEGIGERLNGSKNCGWPEETLLENALLDVFLGAFLDTNPPVSLDSLLLSPASPANPNSPD